MECCLQGSAKWKTISKLMREEGSQIRMAVSCFQLLRARVRLTANVWNSHQLVEATVASEGNAIEHLAVVKEINQAVTGVNQSVRALERLFRRHGVDERLEMGASATKIASAYRG